MKRPVNIVQCAAPDGDVAVIVACYGAMEGLTRLMKIGFRSGVLENADTPGFEDGQFSAVNDIALLPGGGLVALDSFAGRFQVFSSLALPVRMRWDQAGRELAEAALVLFRSFMCRVCFASSFRRTYPVQIPSSKLLLLWFMKRLVAYQM